MPVFGVPSQRRSTKVEKYDTPVATTVVAEEKKARSILFNEAAVKALGFAEEAQVAFSFEDGIFVFNANDPNIPEEYKINVTKNEPRKISDKRTYEYIMKKLELDDQVEHEFDLEASTVDGLAALELKIKVQAPTVPVANLNVVDANELKGGEDLSGSDVIVGEDKSTTGEISEEFADFQDDGEAAAAADEFASARDEFVASNSAGDTNVIVD